MRRLCLVVTPCSLVSLAAFAGPFDRGLVTPGSGWVIHVDVEAAIGSDLGKHILANPRQFDIEDMDDLKAFGIDPTKDLKGVTLFGTGGEKEDGVLVIDATAAVDKLWEHLKTEPHAKAMNVDGVEILSWDDNGERRYGVVKPGKGEQRRLVYMAEDWAPLAAAIKGAGKSTTPDGVPGPGSGSVLYVEASVIPESIKEEGDEEAAAMFKALRSAWLDMGEKDKNVYATLNANFADAKTAGDMKQVLDGLMAFGRLAVGQNPEAAELSKALNAFKVETKDTGLTINAMWPTSDAISALSAAARMEEHDHEDDADHEDGDSDEHAEKNHAKGGADAKPE